ncbi:o-succinylbenzoate synthase [Leptolyngbya sp. PCC 6406]|uniref:o-succinylbenzoate synthase n=1 Tax=Leptolyngbya sp. PCC 6406 TaxID=1173264 RepID=UPI0002AD0C78|nr:o-succinylbenzoate synthase [Leptolyngbya sp. PCC 6406]
MLHLALRPYRRPFRQPLHTHHGPWRERQGWLVRLSDDTGAVGWGEIAPIPWFGTESWTAAVRYLKSLVLPPWERNPGPLVITDRTSPLTAPPPHPLTPLGGEVTADQLLTIPDALPACQFGLEAALADLHQPIPPVLLTPAQCCALLPSGPAALEAWPALWDRGHRTFKAKIAVAPLATELAWVANLLTVLPPTATLRLDANGGLTRETAEQWLHHCQHWGDRLEFLEQPLPPADWQGLSTLGDRFPAQVALDESVATLTQLRAVAAAGWRGTVVIKPAIAGSPQGWIEICQRYPLQPVLSSALETAVGRRTALHGWATWLQGGGSQRALGFGIDHWFADDWGNLGPGDLWYRAGV